MTYSNAMIFIKHTDLMPYFNANQEKLGYDPQFPSHQRMKERYARERDVQLVALLRWDDVINNVNGRAVVVRQRCMCRIKCPINPLPIKGEFEIASPYHICEFLRELGWTLEREHNLKLFK